MHNTPADILDIFLQPGEFYFGDEKTRIRTLLGSCVAVTLWHPVRKIGGMSHYMLPQRPAYRTSQPLDGRYADEVMLLFRRELQRTGTKPGEYQVKMFGGGNMFARLPTIRAHVAISERNIEAGRLMAAENGYRIVAEDLGGDGYRKVVLDLWSGNVWVERTELRSAPVPAG